MGAQRQIASGPVITLGPGEKPTPYDPTTIRLALVIFEQAMSEAIEARAPRNAPPKGADLYLDDWTARNAEQARRVRPSDTTVWLRQHRAAHPPGKGGRWEAST